MSKKSRRFNGDGQPRRFKQTVVSRFVHEIIADLEESVFEIAGLDALEHRQETLDAYSKLSRHRKLLYEYIEELENYAAGQSAVVEIHLQHPTYLRF